jgi:NADP-dependent 3-hydroxy acid dehydrogenase YdfG
MNRLQNHVAIVTGASKGIGRAIAKAFAAEGAHVVLAARHKNELDAAALDLSKSEFSAIAVQTDLTDDAQVRSLIETTGNKFGRIDILVNNAGIGIFKPFTEMSIDEFDAMWKLNMRGTFVATKFALPYMIRQNSGAIVNIASLAGKNSFVNGTGYTATKWALRGWASSLMLEVRHHQIRVVTICPGSVDTDFSSANKRGDKITQPEDIADAALFAVTAPARTMFSEIDVRPTNPK